MDEDERDGALSMLDYKGAAVDYRRSLAFLEANAPAVLRSVEAYIKSLRRECGEVRIHLREARQEIAYLEGQLDALEGKP